MSWSLCKTKKVAHNLPMFQLNMLFKHQNLCNIIYMSYDSTLWNQRRTIRKPKKESYSVVLIEKEKQLFWDWIVTHWLGLTHCMRQKILSIDRKRTTIWLKGIDVRLAKTNIRRRVKGSLLTTIWSLGRTLVKRLAFLLQLDWLL